MTTALHLLTNNSKTKILSSLKKACSSEGVPTLNMASEIEALKLLYSSLQSHKVQEAKMADFFTLSMAYSLTEDSTALERWLSQCASTVALPLPPFCGHGPYTV